MGKVKLFVSRAQAISLSHVLERQACTNSLYTPSQLPLNSLPFFIYI